MCPIAWCGVWRERNARCFEGSERSLLEIKSFFLQTLLVWSVALSHCSCFSLPALLDHCNFGFWFLPQLYIPSVLGLTIFFLIKFFPYLSKKKKDHLVLHCSVASNLGSFVFTLFRVSWVMPKRFCFFFFFCSSCTHLV